MSKLWRKILDWLRGKKPTPEPTPPPAPPPPSDGMPDHRNPGAYRAGFLWKPIGDHDRPAVALLPSAFTHRTRKVMAMTRGGTLIETAARAHNDAVQPNGNREHYRFRHKGASYAGPMALTVETQDGKAWTWTVPNPGQRYDGAITPTVT